MIEITEEIQELLITRLDNYKNALAIITRKLEDEGLDSRSLELEQFNSGLYQGYMNALWDIYGINKFLEIFARKDGNNERKAIAVKG